MTCGTGTVKAETGVASDSGTVAITDLGQVLERDGAHELRSRLYLIRHAILFRRRTAGAAYRTGCILFAMPLHKAVSAVVRVPQPESKQRRPPFRRRWRAVSRVSRRRQFRRNPAPSCRASNLRARRQSRKSPSRRSSIPAAATLSPTSRTQAADQPDDLATSVITASELQTYFARLSQELDDDTKGSPMNKRITTAPVATMVCALTLGLAGCEGQVPQTVARR